MTSLGTLRRISLRSLAAHKLRLALTLLAVVLGTNFVAGGFMLSASLEKAFDDILASQYEGADVVLQSTPAHPLTLRMAQEIGEREDVEKLEVADIRPAVIIGPDGTPYQSGGAGSWILPLTAAEDSVTEVPEIVDGRRPEATGEAALNRGAAERAEISVGDRITVIDAMKRSELKVVGISDISSSTGGWAGVQVAPQVWHEEYSDGVHTGRILIRGEVGVGELESQYPGALVQTGAAAAEEESREIAQMLAFLTYVLLGFGLIALLVGTFIISNTFSMIVAQRTREFALLRAVGMSQGQLSLSVLVEAALIGVVGSTLGILSGVGLVRGIVTAMEAAGFGLPDAGIGLDVRSFLVPVGVGVVATLLSAWVPARRAGAVHPVQAMRTGDQSSTRPVGRRTFAGSVLLASGFATSLFAAFMSDWSTTHRTVLTGVGAVVIVAGVLLVLSGVARGVFSVRPPGRSPVLLLAATNLARNPRRTAATAFALTLGVALVAAVGILGASMTQSVFGAVDEELRADAVVTAGPLTNQGIPQQAVDDARAVEGVSSVYPVVWVPVTVNGRAASHDGQGGVTAVLTGDPTQTLHLTVTAGAFSPERPGVGLSDDSARALGVGVGDTVEVHSPQVGRSVDVPVLVTWEENRSFGTMVVTEATAAELLPDRTGWFTQQMLVSFGPDAAPGAGHASTHEALLEAMKPYGVLQVLTKEQFRVAGADQINQLIALVYALLALSVVVAVLGIVNTLALSVMERRHEFGMLRAVGMQRSQIRRMVTLEATFIAVLGASAGIVTGVWLGWCFVRALSAEGITRWVIPWEQAAVVAVAAVVVGLLAGIWPGRRAARTSPLQAVE